MKYQYGICGAFDFDEKGTGGQSVKTREFYSAMCDKIGNEHIAILESTDYKKHPFSFLLKLIKMMCECEHVVIFPANRGIKVFAPICAALRTPCHTSIHYNVIGGWLAQLVKDNLVLKKSLLKFDSILVETSIMKNDLEALGFHNVHKLVNFKCMEPVQSHNIKQVAEPVRLCYFSRVTKLKGIADAISVVKSINHEAGIPRCIFDIFGPVADDYNEEFEELEKEFTDEIHYRGKVDPKDSVAIISDYDLQLFPTHYQTEGIPGSILDSFFAGVPVVTAKWNSFAELLVEGETGFGFALGNQDDFRKTLSALIADKERIMHMKYRCLQEAQRYIPENVVDEFIAITRGT